MLITTDTYKLADGRNIWPRSAITLLLWWRGGFEMGGGGLGESWNHKSIDCRKDDAGEHECVAHLARVR